MPQSRFLDRLKGAALLCGAAALAAAAAPPARHRPNGGMTSRTEPPQAAAPAAPNLAANIGPQLAQILAPLGAGPQAGYAATGRAVLYTPAGSLGGALRFEMWGSRHCRLVIEIGGGRRFERVVNHPAFFAMGGEGLTRLLPPGGAAENCDLLAQGLALADLATGGAAANDLGPTPASGDAPSTSHRYLVYRTSLSASLNPSMNGGAKPAAGAAGAARIAQASAVTLDLDNATGRPVRAVFTAATGESVEDDYSAYPAGAAIPYASHIETRVGGELRQVVDLDGLTARAGFGDADFKVPQGPPPRAGRAGKGGQ